MRVFHRDFLRPLLGLSIVFVVGFHSDDMLDADDQNDPEGEFSQLWQAVSAERLDPAEIWTALKHSNFRIDSEVAEESGRFEVVSSGMEEPPFVRMLCDANEPGAHLILLGPRNLPYAAWLRNDFLRHDDAQSWIRHSGDWGLAFDGTHRHSFFDASIPHQGDAGVIRFDLSSFLTGVFGEQLPQVRWAKSVRTVFFETEDGPQASLQFRAPTDELLFGTALSGGEFLSADGNRLSFSALTRRAESPLRIRPQDVDVLADVVGAQSRDVQPTSVVVAPAASGEGADSSRRLWNHLFAVELSDPRPLRDPTEPAGGARFRERLLGLSSVWNKEVLPPLTKGHMTAELGRFLKALAEELAYAEVNAGRVLNGDEGLRYIDDPAMLWRGFELAVGPQTARQVFDRILLPTVENDTVPFVVRVSLIFEFARLGRPPWITGSGAGDASPENRFCHALLSAFWQWELTEDDVRTCVLYSEHEQPVVRHAAVEALLRCGQLTQVPPSALKSWMQRFVRQDDQRALFKWMRHCKLHALGRHESGRTYLVQQLASNDNPAPIRREIAQVLAMQVNAARQARRFDDITRAEANQIATAVNAAMKSLVDAPSVE